MHPAGCVTGKLEDVQPQQLMRVHLSCDHKPWPLIGHYLEYLRPTCGPRTLSDFLV